MESNVVCSSVKVCKVENSLHRSVNIFCLTLIVASISQRTGKNRVGDQFIFCRPGSPELKVIYFYDPCACQRDDVYQHFDCIEMSANKNKNVFIGAVTAIQQDCSRFANIEIGKQETPLSERETFFGEKARKVAKSEFYWRIFYCSLSYHIHVTNHVYDIVYKPKKSDTCRSKILY